MVRLDREQFEEKKFDDLIDGFIDKNTNLFNAYVDEMYENYLENSIDRFGTTEDDLYDQARDDELELKDGETEESLCK